MSDVDDTLSGDNKSEAWVLAWWDDGGAYLWPEIEFAHYIARYRHDKPDRILLRTTDKEEALAMYRLIEGGD